MLPTSLLSCGIGRTRLSIIKQCQHLTFAIHRTRATRCLVPIHFRPYQIPIFQDNTTGVSILHWARQIGKSYVLAAWSVDRLLSRPGGLVTVLSNSRHGSRQHAQDRLYNACNSCGSNSDSTPFRISQQRGDPSRLPRKIIERGRPPSLLARCNNLRIALPAAQTNSLKSMPSLLNREPAENNIQSDRARTTPASRRRSSVIERNC
jgi:hypothetical protein